MGNMKIACLVLVVVFAAPLFATNETAISTSIATNPAAGSYETIETKVLKVYEAKDGNADFRAYVVVWKGQEVVVSDPLARSNHKEGDTIKILAMRHGLARGEKGQETLSFQVLPEPRASRIISFSGPYQPIRAKAVSYLDCHPDGVIVYPGETGVGFDELRQPGNAVEKVLDEVQAHRDSERLMVLARPGSAKLFRAVRNLVQKRPIDAKYDLVDADFQLNPDLPQIEEAAGNQPRVPNVTAQSERGEFNPKPRAVISSKQPVMFECRGNDIFFIDEERLETRAAELLTRLRANATADGTNQFLQAAQGGEVGNGYYQVDPRRLLFGIISLEPRTGVSGISREQLDKPDSPFQAVLANLDPKTKYLNFLVRDDSFSAFRLARSIAERQSFETGFELLGAGEPIKIGM
jgi:hypothetical protein